MFFKIVCNLMILIDSYIYLVMLNVMSGFLLDCGFSDGQILYTISYITLTRPCWFITDMLSR